MQPFACTIFPCPRAKKFNHSNAAWYIRFPGEQRRQSSFCCGYVASLSHESLYIERSFYCQDKTLILHTGEKHGQKTA
jgi:hypothetical protein